MSISQSALSINEQKVNEKQYSVNLIHFSPSLSLQYLDLDLDVRSFKVHKIFIFGYCEAQASVRQGLARDGKGWPLKQKALKLKTLA